ncbi:SDR family NAD(P)-dependent oxidoreductase [Mycobacterium sp. CBMA271]|uniref:SDR family NAD(P)-dependent oxidoreductase n=1 Tax=unclassified Mycobacteroides TaxID=2618759 RepID=UPI0012DCEF85|nr:MULTISPECIES: SDR family NAD(P)-dependent oxidoreductase [unclassified Mycobacteroides]MUM19850.1 dehydrogenase [Mycobacteroides sp. CBMA 326]MUM20993.1 SDR family NAD(P)-dependent oxidoreductase [Mycobacteroides sp. CBMA 271]
MGGTSGRSLVLTGATSGLGLALARLLAESGDYHLILLCRNEERRDELVARLGVERVRYVVCDLSALASIRRAAAEVTEAVSAGELAPVGAVVLNAAIHPGRQAGSTSEGLDATMITNLVGPHLLLALLSPCMRAATRIVFVGSGAHERQRWWTGLPKPAVLALADACKPGALAGPQAYVTSKRGTVWLSYACSEHAPDGYAVLAYDPGIMPATGITRNMNTLSRWLFRRVLTKFDGAEGFSTPERSAAWLHAHLTRADTPAGLSYAKVDRHLSWPSAVCPADAASGLFCEANEIADIAPDSTATWWFKPA